MNEVYVTIPGRDLARVLDALDTVDAANGTLAGYHRERRQTLSIG